MFRYASDQSLLFDMPPANADLDALLQIPGVVNIHPAYASILLVFDPLVTTHEEVGAAARFAVAKAPRSGTLHEIPVRYDGPDLEAVAAHHSLSVDRVIALHAGTTYSVAFLGFAPGFAYLSGLPEAIHTPRLASPRKAVPAGSVGIAGGQTGIYPIVTPGGWQLIGRTEVPLFAAARSPMSLLQPADRVKFIPV